MCGFFFIYCVPGVLLPEYASTEYNNIPMQKCAKKKKKNRLQYCSTIIIKNNALEIHIPLCIRVLKTVKQYFFVRIP